MAWQNLWFISPGHAQCLVIIRTVGIPKGFLTKNILNSFFHLRGFRGWDRGSGLPLKTHKKVGFLSNTGPDPLKNYKVTKQAFNVGPGLRLNDGSNIKL